MTKFLLLLASVALFGQAPGSAPPSVTTQGQPSTGPCKYTGSHTATIDLTVTAGGLPENAAVAVSSGNGCLDKQALKAVSGYHFHAAVRDGKPVPTHLRIQINFKRF